jgi:hypothetical protein
VGKVDATLEGLFEHQFRAICESERRTSAAMPRSQI